MKPLTFIKRWLAVCVCLVLVQVLAFGEEPTGSPASDVGKDGLGHESPGERKPMEMSVRGGVQDFGFTYSFPAEKHNNFQSVSIFLDYQDVLFKRTSTPGGFVRYDYHFSLLNQGRILLYAGPGAMAGYVTDRGQPHGLVFGLTGHFGFKYLFDRNISIGASLHPVVGYHVHWVDGQAKLNLYQSGLWRTLMPEFSIGWNIGSRPVEMEGDARFRRAGQSRSRRWSLGIEVAYQPTIYNYLLSMYLANDESRYFMETNQFTFHHNAAIMASAAWHFTDDYQLRLLIGYAGVRPDVHLHELLLRNQWNFKPLNDQGDRFFASVDVGCALKAKDWSKPYALLNLSFGYSLAISADSNIEFFIRSANCYGTPTLYEDGSVVPKERAYQSQFFVSNIALGIALDL